MKHIEPSRFTDPDPAARKLVEIANASEAFQDNRICIELVDGRFLSGGGTLDQFRAGIARAIEFGWIWQPESGNVKFTAAGAEVFA
jgi:hypothetical protein